MKFIDYTKARLRGISDAVVRFFTVFIILVAIAVLNTIAIETDIDMERHIVSLVFGVFCFLLAHVLGERFGKTLAGKSMYLAGALIATAGYYVYIMNVSDVGDVVMVRTVTLIFALLVAFIWAPSIKSETDFNASFLSVFKAFFTSAFFSGIIFGGISLIIVAIDQLLFNVDDNVFAHTANIVWIIWAPMLMLSLIPVFSGKEVNTAKITKSTSYPKFLEILLTYVLIPLASVYTLVLIIYMGKTVALGDWSDNLLEPMLLSYLIAVIIIYVLVKRLGNSFSKYFVRVFPALIALIALFQFTASVIKAMDAGILVSRYYVLMFSVYSVIIGVMLFLMPKRKNGYVASLAVIFALVCAAPFVGAFDVSIMNQSAIVENTLRDNGMLNGNVLTPSDNLSEEDQNRIIDGVEYLYRVDAIGRLEFLPEGFDPYSDFKNVLGFDSYQIGQIDKNSKAYSVDTGLPVDTSGYDYLASEFIYLPLDNNDNLIDISFNSGGQDYYLKLTGNDNIVSIILYKGNDPLLTVPVDGIIDTIKGYSEDNGMLNPDKLTFDFENNTAKIRVVFQSVSVYSGGGVSSFSGDVLILFSMK